MFMLFEHDGSLPELPKIDLKKKILIWSELLWMKWKVRIIFCPEMS